MRLVLAAAAGLALVLAAPGSAQERPRPLLPDLDQGPVGCPGGWTGDPRRCDDWDVCMVDDAAAPNPGCVTSGPVRGVRLRFTTTEDNVGQGPLLIYAHRRSRAQRHMLTRQAFARSDGSVPQSFAAAQRALPDPSRNYVYYQPAPSHRHWHLQNFVHFELQRLDGTPVARDRKNGVCLGDRYTAAGAGRLRNAPGDSDTPLDRLHHRLAFDTGDRPSPYNCQRGRTASSRILGLYEGISVGQGDDYTFGVDYQWLDISRVPSGDYLVVNESNPRRALRELRYDNNAASIVVSIQWPGGAAEAPATITTPPVVKLLNSCPDSATCASPAQATAAGRARVASGRAFACPLTRPAPARAR